MTIIISRLGYTNILDRVGFTVILYYVPWIIFLFESANIWQTYAESVLACSGYHMFTVMSESGFINTP